jgi:hypothetical protein
MIERMNLNRFREAFKVSQYANNFSYEGLASLFDFIESEEEENGKEMEFDTGVIVTRFAEYASISEFSKDYSVNCDTMGDVLGYTFAFAIPGTQGFIIERF